MDRLFVLLILLAPFTASAQHLRIYACAISNDSAGVFLGGSSRGSGLYQSDDTGKIWKHLGWDNIKCYSMDWERFSMGRILYLATGLGVLRSTDYGEHWKQLTDWRISEATSIAVNPIDRNEIYIATAHGPWRTRDGGGTWEPLLSGLHEPYCSNILYEVSAEHPLLLFDDTCGYYRTSADSVWHSLDDKHTEDRYLADYHRKVLVFLKTDGLKLKASTDGVILQETSKGWLPKQEKKPTVTLRGRNIWSLNSQNVFP